MLYLSDGEIQPHIDNHGEEQDVKGSNHQQRFLQHQYFIEGVMNLGEKFKTLSSDPCYYRGEILRQQQNWLRGSGGFYF